MWNLNKFNRNKVEWWLPGAYGQGKQGDVDQKVETFSYKMNKFWRTNVYHGDYS